MIIFNTKRQKTCAYPFRKTLSLSEWVSVSNFILLPVTALHVDVFFKMELTILKM